MADEPRSIRAVFADAEQKRAILENSPYNSSTFQESLLAALTLYEQCLSIADRISLFSPNETLHDITTRDLVYLFVPYALAEVENRVRTTDPRDRLERIGRAQVSFPPLGVSC